MTKPTTACWYTTHNVSTHTVLRIILTYSLWLFISTMYLVPAVIMIIYALCSKRGPFSWLGMSDYLKRHPSQVYSSTNGTSTALATMERREMARRALTVRVLGYIACVRPDITIPQSVERFAAIMAGLTGTINTLLCCFDPSVVAVVFWPYWKKRKDRARARMRNQAGSKSSCRR